jgi:uncharacterized protein (TIGR02246 family)
MIRPFGIALTLALSLLWGPPAPSSPQEDEKAIREAAAKYAEAFARGDVDALAAQYSDDAIYDEGEGPVITGRDEIRKVLAANIAENPGTKITIDIKSIRFTKGRGIEIGTTTLTPTQGDPVTVAYRALYTKQSDGKWLMSSVGPDVTAEGATSAGPLDELTWLLGAWRDSEADVDLTSNCEWDANRRFLVRTFVMKEENRSTLEVTEIIGWDAADRAVRSWVFDSDGGFNQSTWTKRGDDWIISAKGTLPDGGRATAVNILHCIDDNNFTWSSINRDVDGEMLPDVEDVKMVRVTETETPAADAEDKP